MRLMQGDPERSTVYGHDPAAMARRWEQEGARWLHVVDLDGAFAKGPKNRQAIQSIVRSISIPVQVGGGLRNLETISDYLGFGVQRVIIGTAALRDPELLREACRLYPDRIALGIDARDGKVAVEGWKEVSNVDAVDLLQQFADLQLGAVIYTDIQKAGKTDDVTDSVNYRTVAKKVLALIEKVNRYTVEALSTDIANLCLEEPGVLGVRVKVEKPGAVLFSKSVCVQITRMKDQ